MIKSSILTAIGELLSNKIEYTTLIYVNKR